MSPRPACLSLFDESRNPKGSLRPLALAALLVGATLLTACQATVEGKPEVINPRLAIADLSTIDLRIGLHVSPGARRYSMKEAWAVFEYGAKVTGYAEEHFPRIFRSMNLVNTLPPRPKTAADLDIVVSIDRPQGDFTTGSLFAHTMGLSVPFSIFTPNGKLIRRVDTHENLSVIMASLNPGANLEKAYEAAERLSEATVLQFLKRIPHQDVTAAVDRYRETMSAQASGDRDGATVTVRGKPTIFVAFPKDDIEVAEDKIAVLGYITSLNPCLSGLHLHPLGLEWAQTGYRGARHGCSRPRRSPIPAFATRVPATFPR